MLYSSENANRRAAVAVDFARRHRWAKYPCLAVVSAVYSAEFVRLKISEAGKKIRESMSGSERSLTGRITAFAVSAAFAFMTMPFAGVTAYADELPASEETAELPPVAEEISEEENKPAVRRPIAANPEDIAERVSIELYADYSEDYDITLNIRTLKTDVTARFTESYRFLPMVEESFAGYGIPTDTLYIAPVDVTIYCTEEKYILDLSEGYSADITLPIPEEMTGHLDDLKVVRLEDDGSMTIIDGVISDGADGKKISFNTEHFSVFALVSYNDGIVVENISSGAGAAAAGISGDIAVNFSSSVFDEDKRRFKRKKGRKIYRIKRIAKENELLLL